MNMILKQKLKTIDDSMKDVHYKTELASEKISLKTKYIKDLQENKRKLLVEKTTLISGNEEEIFKKKRKIADLQDDIDGMHEKISDSTKVVDRYNKLKDLIHN